MQLVLDVLASVVFLAGLWLCVKTFSFLKTAKPATGKTIGSTIEFFVNKTRYTVDSRISSPFPVPQNKSVAVLYNASDPSDAVVNSWVELHAPWMILMVSAAMFLIPSII